MLDLVAMARRGTAMNNSRNHQPGFGRFRRHVIATSLAAMLVLAGGIGHALAQEDDDELPDTKFFKNMLHGLGLKQDGDLKSGINYQERPPLVVPPTRDLPPPQSADNAVRGNAAWPKDQDEQRRREAAVKRKKDRKPFDWSDLGTQLSPNELKKGAATPKDEALRKPQDFEDANRQYKPNELGYVGGLFGNVKDFFGGGASNQSTTFEAEPPRASLTDPPVGYRSPSPAQPYGVSKDTSRSQPMTPADRVSATDVPASH
jgi:hypothetical protein